MTVDISEYIRLLQVLFYKGKEEIASEWQGFSAEKREQFLLRAKKELALPFVYHQLYQVELENELGKNLCLECRQYGKNAFRHQLALQQFITFLEKHSIRFALLKGTDLAFRVYPSPMLRSFGDWDILIHFEDIKRAIGLLLQDGWNSSQPIPHERPTHYHYPCLRKEGIRLELHWNLPKFEGCTPEQIWRHIHPLRTEGGFQCVLEPEMNLLLLARHASEGHYQVMSLSKLLLDAGQILAHDKVDWEHCKEICEELHQPYPGNLLGAFPDFFQPEDIVAMRCDETCTHAYREIFENREHTSRSSTIDWMMNNGSFSWKWVRENWRKVLVPTIEKRYAIPENASRLRYCWCGARYLSSTAFRVLRHFLVGNKAIQSQEERIAIAEGYNIRGQK